MDIDNCQYHHPNLLERNTHTMPPATSKCLPTRKFLDIKGPLRQETYQDSYFISPWCFITPIERFLCSKSHGTGWVTKPISQPSFIS